MYIQKGGIYEPNTGNINVTQKITFSGAYIDIPVLVKFNLPIPMFSPYIEGGVSYGILLSAKEKNEQTTNIPGMTSSSTETDIKDQLTKSDVSLIFGVGIELLILEIDARIVLGQTKLGKDSDAKVFNNGIIFTAGLRF
jgi:hypothetical protein